jgi:hypothetical protein
LVMIMHAPLSLWSGVNILMLSYDFFDACDQ